MLTEVISYSGTSYSLIFTVIWSTKAEANFSSRGNGKGKTRTNTEKLRLATCPSDDGVEWAVYNRLRIHP